MNIEPDISREQRRDARGTSQLGLRLYNERLLLSLIRRHDALSKVELARLTGLTAQTVSVIVRDLERNGLVVAGTPQRGKVGQPMVPFRLQPDGAFALGLKLGRRSGEVMLMDLAGKVRGSVSQSYEFPSPKKFLAFALKSIERLLRGMPLEQRQRITGLGIATPFELWNWTEEIGAPSRVMEAWRGFDLTAELARRFSFPVIACNDATSACAAELLFGKGQGFKSFAYIFVGYFVGGGTVIDGNLFTGRNGYSGAFGPLPMAGRKGGFEQLIRHASIYTLENELAAKGKDPMMLAQSPDDWGAAEPALGKWIEATAAALAQAAVAAMSVVEFDAIVIDGNFPAAVRSRLVERIRHKVSGFDLRGLPALQIEEGVIGRSARALGAASLPLFANFIIDRNVLFKERV